MTQHSKTQVIKPHITIYPDHGGAWYWVNYEGTDSLQGGVPQTQHRGLLKKFPRKLMEDFEDWYRVYTRDAYDFEHGLGPFDWKRFHFIGIQLSVRLKQAFRDDARIFYDKPMEDPNAHLNERREVLEDGQLI